MTELRASARFVAAGALAVAIAVGAWFFTRATDEAKINRLLDELTEAGDVEAEANANGSAHVLGRALRVRHAFDAAFQPSARVDVPDLGTTSLEALETTAAAAATALRDGQVRFDRRAITLDDGHTVAEVAATARFEGHAAGAAAADAANAMSGTRPAELQLRKTEGTWKITTLHVGAL